MPRARLSVTVKEIDRGWKDLRRLAKELRGPGTYAKAGIIGPAAAAAHRGGAGLSVVEIALILEFGAEDAGIPERAVFRVVFQQNQVAYVFLLKQLLRGVLGRKLQVRTALAVLGARMASDFRAYILEGSGVAPPNAPSTLAKKLSLTRAGGAAQDPRPWVDTGQVINALSWSTSVAGVESDKP